ncbi:hypothetical protein [Nocardia sp. CA-120079]|uniref:hypothetical protein n=1 Tax=Nocardia sp. CA-120079 TaxID=3239974 RepID=UPI003D99090D
MARWAERSARRGVPAVLAEALELAGAAGQFYSYGRIPGAGLRSDQVAADWRRWCELRSDWLAMAEEATGQRHGFDVWVAAVAEAKLRS